MTSIIILAAATVYSNYQFASVLGGFTQGVSALWGIVSALPLFASGKVLSSINTKGLPSEVTSVTSAIGTYTEELSVVLVAVAYFLPKYILSTLELEPGWMPLIGSYVALGVLFPIVLGLSI